MVISVGKEEGKWMILLRCDSLAKLVQDILCQFTPPQKNNNFVVIPQGFYIYAFRFDCLDNFPT